MFHSFDLNFFKIGMFYYKAISASLYINGNQVVFFFDNGSYGVIGNSWAKRYKYISRLITNLQTRHNQSHHGGREKRWWPS